MFRKHQGRRSTSIVFVIFRLVLSVVMFGLLLGGLYSAYKHSLKTPFVRELTNSVYKHFSGLDPLKLSYLSLPKKIVPSQISPEVTPANRPAAKYVFRFLLIADSHSDNANLKKAITQAKQTYPDLAFTVGLGDYTQVGTLDELKIAKAEFDLSSLRYFLLAGDHDLWDSRDKQTEPTANFKTVFGLTYQSFTYGNARFILLYNSDNYAGLAQQQLVWLQTELEKARSDQQSIFVFLHEPLFHPFSDHFMGRVEKSLKNQARNLTYQLKEAGVKKIFAGDTHYFSEYSEPETGLPMMTVGAVTADRNPQAPRFAIAYVFEDGSIKVEDVQIR